MMKLNTLTIPLLMLVFLSSTRSENQNLSASIESSIGISENLYNSFLIGEQSYVNSYASLAYSISDAFRVVSSFSKYEVLTDTDFS